MGRFRWIEVVNEVVKLGEGVNGNVVRMGKIRDLRIW